MTERRKVPKPETMSTPEGQIARTKGFLQLLVLRKEGPGTIRARLLLVFVLIGLLPAVAISVGSILAGFSIGRRQAVAHLESVAVLKQSEIEAWVEGLQPDLALALTSGDALGSALALLEGRDPSAAPRDASAIRARLQTVIGQTGRYEDLFLLGLEGNVVLSTDPAEEGETRGSQAYFRQGLAGPYVQRPFYSPTSMHSSVFAARPIVDGRGQVVGVLAGRASADKLNAIMAERTGLGNTGETYLVDATSTLLTPTRFGQIRVWATSKGIEDAVLRQLDGSGLYDNYQYTPVVGAYRWLPELQVALVAEQEQSEAFQPVYLNLFVVAGVALLTLFLAVFASLRITRSIATPLDDLVQAATQVAAGDLARSAVPSEAVSRSVERNDEIGRLAQAFSSMTVQLRGLIGNLEQRVAERTRELERRSAYLEASAEVGRVASSILDRDRLAGQAVELIRQQFDLYYVGLFLVDESGEWAVLRAGSGEVGPALLARGHRLQVGGESMIGWSIANGRARIALEAGEDAIRLATPELPDTRSEAALPLRSRGQVIGALTVQHTRPGAFDQDTIVVLQTMADQLAVALDNARLFAERRDALEAMQRAYGELSREAWAQLLRAQPDLGYRSDEHGVAEAGDVWRPEMELAVREGRTVRAEAPAADGKLPLAIPIKVRGEVVGVLDTYKRADAGDWTQDELALLEQIVEQLDVALESARLHQDAQIRATREQTLRRVTEQIRRPRDVEAILQNTLAELTKALGVPRAYVRLGTEAHFAAERGTQKGEMAQARDLDRVAGADAEAESTGSSNETEGTQNGDADSRPEEHMPGDEGIR
jgi:GAF domain-containing protein/HAMP domain-containing protein